MKMKLFTLFMAVSFVLAACGGNNNESKEKIQAGKQLQPTGKRFTSKTAQAAMVRIWPAVPLRV
ncbi:cytochrome c551 [Bacillus licheniformis]|nr:cytochrome c551 [Bacillus licheniformis]